MKALGIFNVFRVALCFCFMLFFIVTATRADEITLSSGDVIHGTIVKQDQKLITIEHPDLGTLQIPMKQIKSFSKTSEIISPGQAPSKEPEPKHPEEEMPNGYTFDHLNDWAAKMKQKGYKMSFNLSLDSSSGETEEQSFRFGVIINRELQDIRALTDSAYYYKKKAGEVTDNKLTLGHRRDKLLPDSQWFFFYEGRYDFDDFESWRHRASGHLGPGYAWLDNDTWKLNLRFGPGVRKEWKSENDAPRFEGIIGLDATWNISERQNLTGHTAFYPVLTDTEDYRTRSGLTWRYFLSRDLDLSFLIGLEHEYQNIVDPDGFKNNTRVYGGVQYDF